MVTQCSVIEASSDSLYPPVYTIYRPGEIDRIAADVESLVDCDGQGVTILSATWAIHPDDDDGNVTLSGETFSGFVCSVLVTTNAAADGNSYRLDLTVTTSDGRTLLRQHAISVQSMRALGE